MTARTNESVATGGFSRKVTLAVPLRDRNRRTRDAFRRRRPSAPGGCRHAATPAARSSRLLTPSPSPRPATKRSPAPARHPAASIGRALHSGRSRRPGDTARSERRSAAGLASVGGLAKRSKYQRSSVRIGSFSGDASCPHATFCRSCTAPSRCAGTTIRIVQAGSLSSSGAWRWRKSRNSSCIGSACR